MAIPVRKSWSSSASQDAPSRLSEPTVRSGVMPRPTAQVPAASASVPMRLLRFPAVHHRTGLSRSTIWRLERRGDFPKHRRISPNAVAWLEQEVVGWIRTRPDR